MTIIDWENITNYIETVGTTAQTFTFKKTQGFLKVTNRGQANLTYTIGAHNGTLTPGQNVSFTEQISSYTMTAASGIQAFEIWSTEYGTEKEDKGDDLSSITVDLANNMQYLGLKLTDYPRQSGETDDTGRFQRLFAAVNPSTYSPSDGLGYPTATNVQVSIPAGIYQISDEINLPKYVSVICDGKAIIQQNTSGKRIFVFASTYLVDIQGICFMQGTHAIDFQQPTDIDSTIINIERCEFQAQSDYAINTNGTVSANLTIHKCRFIYPNGVLVNNCDTAWVDDCWVEVGNKNFTANRAVFVNQAGGRLRMRSMFGVPTMGSPTRLSQVRWVDNYYEFYATNCRFGAEQNGMTIVYNYAGYGNTSQSYMGGAIVIENSETMCGQIYNYPDACVVYLMTNVPQLIRLQGNDYQVGAPYIQADSSLNLDTYFSSISSAWLKFNIRIDTNMVWDVTHNGPGTEIPYQLRRFVNKSYDNFIYPIQYDSVTQTSTTVQYTFDVPYKTKSFTWLITLSTNPTNGAQDVRLTATYFVSMVTGSDGTNTNQYLQFAQAYAPSAPSGVVGADIVPTLSSIFWGTGTSGSAQRVEPSTSGGQFSLIFNNSNAYSNITVIPMHINYS